MSSFKGRALPMEDLTNPFKNKTEYANDKTENVRSQDNEDNNMNILLSTPTTSNTVKTLSGNMDSNQNENNTSEIKNELEGAVGSDIYINILPSNDQDLMKNESFNNVSKPNTENIFHERIVKFCKKMKNKSPDSKECSTFTLCGLNSLDSTAPDIYESFGEAEINISHYESIQDPHKLSETAAVVLTTNNMSFKRKFLLIGGCMTMVIAVIA